MKVFVTGATGYLGRYLVVKLANLGYIVHALVRDPEKSVLNPHENIKIFQGDLSDEMSINRAMQGCENVFHLAAFTDLKCTQIDKFHEVNVVGTRNVLLAARENGIKRFVFTSSLSVFGPSNGKFPITEKQPRLCSFQNDYELTKAMAEDLVLKENKNGMQTIVLNVSRIYGPGDPGFSNGVNKFIEIIMNKKRLFFPSRIWVETNYVFIEDVVQAHINALQLGTSGEKYIVGGINSTYSQFISTIKQISKSSCKVIKINYQLIKALLGINRLFMMVLGRRNIISPPVLDSLFTNRKASSQKGVTQLKYRVTSLAAGVEKTVSFLNN